MATTSRTSLIKKLTRVLKKHYKPVVPDLERTVLDQLLFASCLENAHANAAEEAFAALVHNFFDWNEVRVSTIRELAEEMTCLPEPTAAADRVKRVLQSVFEASYAFDLEELRKMNLGPATENLSKIDGTTKFTVAYVVRMSLGGHTIPIDSGTLRALWVVELITEADIASETVPGLERAVAKNKGIEFGSLLHQLGADFVATPYAPSFRALLKEIHPDCDDRLPRRRSRKTQSDSGETTPQKKKKSDDHPSKPKATDTPATKITPEKEKSKKKPARSKTEPDVTAASSKKPAKKKTEPDVTAASSKKPAKKKTEPDVTTTSSKKPAKKKTEPDVTTTSSKKPAKKKTEPDVTAASSKKPAKKKTEPDVTAASSKKSAKKKIEKPVSSKKQSPESKPKSTPKKKKGKVPVEETAESKKGGVSGLSKRKPR